MSSDPLRSYPIRPFADAPWPHTIRPAVEIAWQWHEHLWQESLTHPSEVFHQAYQAFEQNTSHPLLPPSLRQAVEHAIQTHAIPRALFSTQLQAAARLVPPVRFEDWPELQQFLNDMIYPHAGIIAYLTDAHRGWQQPMVHDLAQAFFLTGRLVHATRDLKSNRIFFPRSELQQFGLSEADLWEGRPTESTQKFFWQWSVRARLALSMALPLAYELPRKYRRTFKRWVIGTLEVLREIERQAFDLWSTSPTLSARQRLQISLQALAGRTTFRTR